MKIITKQVDGKLKAGEILYMPTNLYHYQDGKLKEMAKAGYYLVVRDGLIDLKNYTFIKAAVTWITETDGSVKIYAESNYELVLKDYQCLELNQKEQTDGKAHIITKNGINL